MWFLNPKYKILPTVSFLRDRGPVVLILYENNGSTEKFMIHPCLWKHHLPPIRPDQLWQAVIQPCILKLVKASKYSTRYHIFHQYVTFNGIDTYSATTYRKFDSKSKILSGSEARSIFNRPDINAHIPV